MSEGLRTASVRHSVRMIYQSDHNSRGTYSSVNRRFDSRTVKLWLYHRTPLGCSAFPLGPIPTVVITLQPAPRVKPARSEKSWMRSGRRHLWTLPWWSRLHWELVKVRPWPFPSGFPLKEGLKAATASEGGSSIQEKILILALTKHRYVYVGILAAPLPLLEG